MIDAQAVIELFAIVTAFGFTSILFVFWEHL